MVGDGVDQLVDAGEDATANRLVGQVTNPPFDLKVTFAFHDPFDGARRDGFTTLAAAKT